MTNHLSIKKSSSF